MAFSGNVNGHLVESDKDLDRVDGPMIYFTDGSTYNVETGETVNAGPGRISVDAKGKKTNERVSVTKSFPASPLKVRDLIADLTVELGNKPGIEVEISGTKENVEAITAAMANGSVAIGGGKEFGGGNQVAISISRISGANISFNSLFNMQTGVPPTKVTVMVPVGTPLDIEGGEGEIQIGDIEGNLVYMAKGDGDASIGRMANTTLAVMSDGGIAVSRVIGALNVGIYGDGDVEVAGGNLSQLQVNISADGDFRFGGKATDANLRTSGDGSISVSQAFGTLTMEISGDGDIDVNGGEVTKLNILVTGDGDAAFRGKAVDGHLKTTGDGDIDVHYIKNEPTQIAKGDGDIDVGNW